MNINFTRALPVAALLYGSSLMAAPKIKVQNIQTGGTGCPAGTVTQSVSQDKQAFTLIFDEFFVELAGRRPMQRRNCQIDLTLKVPSGWQFSIATFDYRGYAYLERGVEATQTAYYYFQGGQTSGMFETRIGGNRDFDDVYQVTDTLGIASLVWSPCGASRNMQINTDLRLKKRSPRSNAYGYMSTDSIDGQFRTQYWFRFGTRWRRC